MARIHDFVAHKEGVNGISWGPSTSPALLMPSVRPEDKFEATDKFKLPNRRLVSGGNDNIVRLWEFVDGTLKETKVGEHTDWVRDVAWSNNIGLLHETIATCSEDGVAKVWKQVQSKEGSKWDSKDVKIAVPLWKVSWS